MRAVALIALTAAARNSRWCVLFVCVGERQCKTSIFRRYTVPGSVFRGFSVGGRGYICGNKACLLPYFLDSRVSYQPA